MCDKIQVYVVEDSETDLFFVRSAIETTNTLAFSGHAANGKLALEFLTQSRSLPDLILMDINMPVMGGHECLKIIRSSDNLKSIPVVIFSTSEDPTDVKSSFSNFASGYIIKPNTYDRYLSFIKNIETYWASISLLPS